MLGRSLPVALLALAPLAASCSADGPEDAPLAATGGSIAQAPPGALGADVPRPPSASKLPATEPTAIKPAPKPHAPLAPPSAPTQAPLAPSPLPGPTPPKATEL